MPTYISKFVCGWVRASVRILAAVAVLQGGTTYAFYDGWNGSTSGFWSVNANWTVDADNRYPGGILGPVGLIFASGAGHLFNTNDIVGRTWDGVLIYTNGYVLRGNDFGISRDILASFPTGFSTIENNVTFATAGGNIQVFYPNSQLGMSGQLNVNNISLLITNNGTLVLGTMAGSGTYSANFTGPGFSQLQGNVNPFAGIISLSSQSSLQTFGTFSNAQFNVNGLFYCGGPVGRAALTGAQLYPGYYFSPGTMTVVSNFTADATTTMNFRLQGTVAGQNYDQIVYATTNSGFSLGSAQLLLQPTGPPIPGTQYKLIDMAGTNTKVSGTFTGWPEGGQQFVSNGFYAITYKGGDGNDVVVTLTNAASSWKGGVASTAWSVATNWLNSLPPQQDYDLIFPVGPTNLTSSNNILLGRYHHILFQGGNYHINGLPFSLTGGITDSNTASSFNIFDSGITLAADQTFTETGLAMMITNLVPGAHNLTINGSGSMDLISIGAGTGTITAAGPGTTVLFGTNTFTGAFQVSNCRLTLNTGDFTSSSGITASNGFVLIGSTCVSPSVTAYGAGSTVDLGGAFGLHNMVGNLDIEGGLYELGIQTAANFSRLHVTGSVKIGQNVGLQIDGAYAENVGEKFILIDNAGPDPISGEFQNLPEGTVFTPPFAHSYRITYRAGDGNDLMITGVPAAPHIWEGTPTSQLWTTAADWASNSPPSAGDYMVFPAFSAGYSPTNDFPAFMTFESLAVSNNYTFYGNPVALTGGFLLYSDATFNPGLRLASSQTWLVPSNFVVNGAVDLTTNQLNFSGGGTMIFSNNLTGTTGAVVSLGGLSALRFNGSNNYSGVTRVRGAAVTLNNGPFLNSPMKLEQTDWFVTNSVLVSNSVVTFAGGVSNLASFSGKLLNGSLTLSNGAFTVGSAGMVSNSPVTIAGGTLFALGQMPASPITLLGGTLSGTGIVANITGTGGAIAPGAGFGQLRTGTLSLGSNTTVQLKIAGKVPGVSQDQLQVNGGVNLTNTTLSLLLTDQTIKSGDTIVLIDNDGSDAINGTFAGLPEGSTFPLGLLDVKLSYVGGTGNDVTLTVIAQIQRATWTGAGNTNTWDTATNWARSTLPLAGDSLYFPPGAGNLANANTLGATSYAALVISGSNYLLEASNVLLTAGIVASNPVGTNTVDSIQFGASSVISNASGDTLILSGLYSNSPLNFLTFGSLEFRGEIVGDSNLVMAGTGTLHLYNTNSPFDGDVTLQSGLTEATSAASLGSSFGNRSISVSNTATLLLEAGGDYAEELFLGGTLHVAAPGIFFDSANTITHSNGNYLVDAAASLFVGGPVFSTVGLRKEGAGEMTLQATNNYTGATVINGGTLYVAGLATNAPAPSVQVNPGATLRGGGLVGPIFVNQGVLAPGYKDAHAALASHDGISLSNSSTYRVRLSNVPLGFYDRIDVTGPVVLVNAQLRLDLDFEPPIDSAFTIIVNDGTDPVFGSFSGIPQNGFYTNGPAVFRVAYNGGSGNDVVVTTDHYLSTGVTRTWTGAGTNALWSNPQNWAGNVAPNSGDALYFPPGALQTTNQNDFVTNTFFNALTIGGVNYRLTGNSVAVLSGCSATNASGANTLALPLSILTNMMVRCEQSGATLAFEAALDSNSRTVIFGGNGTILGLAPVLGFGGLNCAGPGLVELRGTNIYTSETRVSGGLLRFQNSPLGVNGGNVVVTNGGVLELSATTNVSKDFTISGTVRFTNAAAINVQGSFRFPSNTAAIFDVAPGTLASVVASFASDGGGPVKQGAGDLYLLVPDMLLDAYSGPALINQGRLIFDSQTKGVTAKFGDLVVNAGGTLAATGQVNHIIVNAGGTLAPGLFSGVGPLTVQRGLTFSPDGILAVNLEGVSPSLDFDTVFVTGAVNLNNAILSVTLGYDAVIDSDYQIISNDGADPISGSFAGLPEGAAFSITNGAFRITYSGGDGNDVVLTRIDTPPLIKAFARMSNGAQIDGHGEPGSFVLIEATESLAPPILWEVLDVQVPGASGQVSYLDTDATNHVMRFYRLTTP